ncbi:ABC transporter substrate-binding protein [Arthrobacter sp. SDTb3-6]|uniref:ABC transporter substrate-binding protein n=1 Tax=Arthrobacter sp. SDTb3-6 TaxID=2713571 RepID=UPI00159D65DE|nr:ABC transporter substrate-binding protein [Arthrobacter sp. SDTb3-6]NVN00151.1 ABC transporter substrate-binding protein [Arthrobacter sp. SDTb3-6]
MRNVHVHRHPGRSLRPASLRAAALAAVAMTAVVLGGCSSSPGSSNATSSSAATVAAPGTANSGNITWWASPITSSGADPRTVLVTAFEKAYPDIKVKLISAPTDTDTNRATLTTQISGGAGPDVYMGDVIWPAQFAAHQLADPLSKYLPASYFGTFAPGLVAGATYKGQVYGAPFFEDQGFLYYRKDLLAKNNMKVPTTWEELMTDSRTIQSKGEAQYGYVFQGASYEGATCNFMEFLTDAGGAVLNKDSTSSAVNSAAALKALKFEQELVTSGVSPKAESTYQELQSMNEFSAGKSVFLRNWDYGYSTSQAAGSAVVGKVGVAPMPTFGGESTPGYSNIGGWNLYVNPHSQNVAADLTFIKWMTGNDAQKILATQFSEIPTNQAVRTSADVIKSNAVLAVVPQTKLVPRPAQTPFYPQVSTAIYTNVSAVLAGSKTPATALKDADSAINSALSGGGL